MARPFERLFSPLQVGPMRLENRIMVAPMERNYGRVDGAPSERTIEHYARIARGGPGWIDVESTFVDASGRGRTHQLGLHQDASIDGFRRLAASAHAAGARIGVELHHAGRNTSPLISGQTPLAPSPVECPEAGSGLPHELDVAEIAGLHRRYAEAAARAAAAGLDAVELHSAHGYLPLAFLSPLFNRRTDGYGGSLANRMRFALEALGALRGAVPEHVAVGCRFSVSEFLPGGLTLDDTLMYARALVDAGADYLSVSAGVYASFKRIIPPMDVPPGWLLEQAAAIRDAVDVPVVGVSRLTTPGEGEAALRRGLVDVVAYGRAFLADPAWPRKARDGRADEQVRCIGCNQGCVARIAVQRDVTCLVNPVCGRELEVEVRPAADPGVVLVAGAGPAGLEAARVAAERGHHVVLVEAGPQVGGELRTAAALPLRDGWVVFLRQADERLARAGVELRCGTRLDQALVASLRPDAIVVATGAAFLRPDLGLRSLDPSGLVEAGVRSGQRVLLLGGDTVALGLADWCADHGAEVVVLSQAAALDEGAQTGLVDRLTGRPGITLRPDRELRSVDDDGLTIVRSGAIGSLFEERLAPVDLVVETRLREPRPVAAWLRQVVGADRLHVVGDARSPRSALEAVHEGLLAGLAV